MVGATLLLVAHDLTYMGCSMWRVAAQVCGFNSLSRLGGPR